MNLKALGTQGPPHSLPAGCLPGALQACHMVLGLHCRPSEAVELHQLYEVLAWRLSTRGTFVLEGGSLVLQSLLMAIWGCTSK